MNTAAGATAPESVVIIGAGHAGFQAAKSLRDQGYGGPVTVVDGNAGAPYQRPPLSKAYLTGKSPREELLFAAADYYSTAAIDVRDGVHAIAIDRTNQSVRLSDGSDLSYGHLILATGAEPRELAIPGHDAAGIHSLRTLEDADGISEQLQNATNVVVIGAGFIGLEFVSVALARGHSPIVIEAAPRVLGRAVSPVISEFFFNHYREQGATILLNTGVAEFETVDGRVSAVIDAHGVRHPADLVVVGIGVLPHAQLAEAAGLEVDNGVRVDEYLTTSDPNISAIGDCCSYPSATALRRVRLESVQNATDHARCVAAKIVGAPRAYAEVPWFWSDQGAKKLQIAGLAFDGDQAVVRGDVSSGKFSVFVYREGELIAVDSVDKPMDHMNARRIMAAGLELPAEAAADAEFDLKSFARGTSPQPA
ncbi:NAD(P)/FAD-dependent oxidoreductase [Homoserinimonas sp. A520]